ncbi:MAG: hypothetical protein AAF108_02860 [Planctomycetota bacterium]
MAKRRQPSRSLTAADVATETGRSKRAVQLWAKDGCPHAPGPKFNLSEVHEWLDSRGLDRVKPGGGGGARRRTSKKATARPKTPKPNTAPPPPATGRGKTKPKSDVQQPSDAPAADIPTTGDAAYDQLLREAYEQVYRLSARARRMASNNDASIREIGIVQGAIKQASAEYRQLVREGERVREVLAAWVPRADAMRAIAGILDACAGDLDKSRAAIPPAATRQLIDSGLVDAANASEVERVIGAELHASFQDTARNRRAMGSIAEREL